MLVHLFLRWGGVQQRIGFVLCHTKLAAHYALSAWCNCEAEKFARLDTIYRESHWRMQGFVVGSCGPVQSLLHFVPALGQMCLCSVRLCACHCYRTAANKKSFLSLIYNAFAHMRQSTVSFALVASYARFVTRFTFIAVCCCDVKS